MIESSAFVFFRSCGHLRRQTSPQWAISSQQEAKDGHFEEAVSVDVQTAF